MELHNIGIALSGGGIRATIFHLGVLKWVAEKGVLEEALYWHDLCAQQIEMAN